MRKFSFDSKKFRDDELSGGIEVFMHGELLFEDAHDFMRNMPMAVEAGGKKVVFNMKDLDYIDSAGLGAILYVSEAMRMKGQRLEIRFASKNNLRLLKTIHRVGTFELVVEDK